MHSSTSTSDVAPPRRVGWLSALALVCAGIVSLAVLLEIVLRVLPVSTSTALGYYFDDRLLTYPAHHAFTTAAGWDLENNHRHSANNFGFVADRDFVPGEHAIALIGDSFVEASMLDSKDKLAHRLEVALGGRPVYAMGEPGSSLLDYAERIRFSAARWSVSDYVLIVEEGDVLQALCGSGQVHGRCFDERTRKVVPFAQGEAGTLKNILRRSALAQYLISQLKLDPVTWANSLFSRAENSKPDAASNEAAQAEKARALESVVDAFVANVAAYRLNRGKVILVLEDRSPSGFKRSALHETGRRLLTEKSIAAGFEVIDTGDAFRAVSARTGLNIAVAPRDHHWNGLASEVVSGLIASKFQ